MAVITPNETEARVCLGLGAAERADEEELGRRLLERGCGAALLTLGERGCLCVTAAGSEHVPGFAVSQVVDTTGAGDAFNAGLAVALAEGRPLTEAARFANAAADSTDDVRPLLHQARHPAGLPHAPARSARVHGRLSGCCTIALRLRGFHDVVLVTNDSDFSSGGIEVLTTNPRLLRACS